jgi:phthiodiolone/phenolphthiodiolone dimycocerosates ketoreductase
VVAQLALTLSHFAPDRFFLTLGAGERKQFEPYGIPRNKPFAHLEDAIKVIRLLWDNKEPVSYEGPIYKLDRAILNLGPGGAKNPPMLIAGGPGKALRFAGELADGWVTYWMAVLTPEMYAEQVKEVKQHAEQAGRDPEKVRLQVWFPSVIGPDDAAITAATENAALRWDAAAMLPDGAAWERVGLPPNPLGAEWSYARDLIPMWWSREDALKIVDQTPPEAVRRNRITGTPSEAAELILPFIEAGCNEVAIANYLPLIMSGDFSDALQGSSQVLETIKILKKHTG